MSVVSGSLSVVCPVPVRFLVRSLSVGCPVPSLSFVRRSPLIPDMKEPPPSGREGGLTCRKFHLGSKMGKMQHGLNVSGRYVRGG